MADRLERHDAENIRRAFDPLYLSIFLDSAVIAGLATLIALLIGYPAAYAIARHRANARPPCSSLPCCPSGPTT